MQLVTDTKHRIIWMESDGEPMPAGTLYEIDREAIFGDWSDFHIKCYCYKQSESEYSIYPAFDSEIMSRMLMQDEYTQQLEQVIDTMFGGTEDVSA